MSEHLPAVTLADEPSGARSVSITFAGTPGQARGLAGVLSIGTGAKSDGSDEEEAILQAGRDVFQHLADCMIVASTLASYGVSVEAINEALADVEGVAEVASWMDEHGG